MNADIGMAAQGKGREGIWQLPRGELGLGGTLRASHREEDLGTAGSGESEEQSERGKRAWRNCAVGDEAAESCKLWLHGHSLEKSPYCHRPSLPLTQASTDNSAEGF